MDVVKARLEQADIVLRDIDVTRRCTRRCRRWKNLLFVQGLYPLRDGVVVSGKAGLTFSTEDVQAAGRLIAKALLETIRYEIGNLEHVDYIVRCLGYINAGDDFTDMPAAMNGFSDVLTAAFGENGKHTRAAIGVCELDGGAAMAVNAVVKLREGV